MPVCSECEATKPLGAAYVKGWIHLSTDKPEDFDVSFCSWHCLHGWTVGCVSGEGFMQGKVSA